MSAKTGICRLTGTRGAFVKAHLIPQAFAKLPTSPLPALQLGIGKRPVRRWTGWYDHALVTRTGEDILMTLDTWAVKQLRRHRMVWSGWGSERSLGEIHTPIADSGWGIRQIEGLDKRKLRLFFHSLLWRAAATLRPEFASVRLPEADVEKLRELIVSGDAGRIDFYPVQLTQLSTIGPRHNYAPVADVKRVPALAEEPGRTLDIFRFCFDGLVAHFHRHASDDGHSSRLGHLLVGGDLKLTFSTQTYEGSTQSQDVNAVIRATQEQSTLNGSIAEALRNWRA